VDTRAEALAWLDAERASPAAAVAHMTDNGWPGHATRLAATLRSYLDRGDQQPEAITTYSCALRAARRTGDRAAEAAACTIWA